MKITCALLFVPFLVLIINTKEISANPTKDVRSVLKREACGRNENYSTCASSCERNCDDINNDNHAGERCIATASCEKKCVCQDGYVRENSNGKCIRIQECPRVKH